MGRGGMWGESAWRNSALAGAAAAALGLAGCDRASSPAPEARLASERVLVARAAPTPVAAPSPSSSARVLRRADPAPMAAQPQAVVQPAPPPPPPQVAPPRELPEPLASAPEGGLSLEGMLSALEQERQALLALTDPGATEEIQTPSKALKKGSKGEQVEIFCQALATRGFLPECAKGDAVFGKEMEKAARAAQRSYGLVVDGIADAQLYNALRMSAGERAGRIEALIQEWRAIERHAASVGASRYIVVNIPSFEAKAVGAGEIQMETPVVVGRADRQTPVGMMSLRSLKFNPDWRPPTSILKRDVYPRMKSGGSWIDKHGLELQDSEGNRVNWRGLSVSDLRENGYRFVQPPGPSNALGRMKFETDSKEDIYLHDTNEPALFNQAMRAKSSGCVRVKEWMDLASWAAAEKAESLEKKLDKDKTFYQKIDRIPVYVTYQLADFQKGKSTVYPDVYKRFKQPEAINAQAEKEPASAGAKAAMGKAAETKPVKAAS